MPQVDNPGEDKPEGQGWVASNGIPKSGSATSNCYRRWPRFDGRVAGVNLPETAVGVDVERDKTGFACDRYFAAELENIAFARKVFSKSPVVLYANFWPCEWNNDRSTCRDFRVRARTESASAGRTSFRAPAQMKNSYPFFNQYKGKLALVAMAVQEPTLTYTNPKTKKKFTREEFVDFAENYLGVNIIFWSRRLHGCENSSPRSPDECAPGQRTPRR